MTCFLQVSVPYFKGNYSIILLNYLLTNIAYSGVQKLTITLSILLNIDYYKCFLKHKSLPWDKIHGIW